MAPDTLLAEEIPGNGSTAGNVQAAIFHLSGERFLSACSSEVERWRGSDGRKSADQCRFPISNERHMSAVQFRSGRIQEVNHVFVWSDCVPAHYSFGSRWSGRLGRAPVDPKGQSMEKKPLKERIEEIRNESVRSMLRAGTAAGDSLREFYIPRALELFTDYVLELEEKVSNERS